MAPGGGALLVRLAEGDVTVRVPPGALDAPLELSGRTAERPAGGASVSVELGPEGTQFRVPVEIDFRPVGGDVARGVPWPLLHVATVEGDHLRVLPSKQSKPGVITGSTRHFSRFALSAPCLVGGAGRAFALSGCKTFNPSIESDSDVELSATAGRVSLFITTWAKASAAPALLTVAGLPAGATWYLRADGSGDLPLVVGADGRVQFFQDLSVHHVLILSGVAGSLNLSPSTCLAPVGVFDATTQRCRLTQDVRDADVTISRGGLTLDCADPNTGARHRIGSATVRSFGVLISGSDVRVINCDIENVDEGIIGSAMGLRVSNVRVSTVEDLGVAFHQIGPFAEYSDISADGHYGFGFVGLETNSLSIRHATFTSDDIPLLLQSAIAVELDDVTLRGATSLPLGTVPGAVTFADAHGVVVKNLRAEGVTGFTAILAAAFDSEVEVVGAVITGASGAAVRFDGPGTSSVSDSTLSTGLVGLELPGGTNYVFHNNVFGNRSFQVTAAAPVELSDTRSMSPTLGQGNFWSRGCPGALFVAGLDSNRADVVDSHPFGLASAWNDGASPGCAVAAPLITRPVDSSLLSDARPVIEGTSPSGSTVQIKEGPTVLATTTAAAGSFSVRLPQPLAEGPHFLRAQAQLSGVSSPLSPAARFVVDTLAPAPPVFTFPAAGTMLFGSQLTLGGRAEAEALLRVYEGSVLAGETRALADGSFELTLSVSAGGHALSATAEDLAGNESPRSPLLTVTVEQASPQQPLSGSDGKMFLTRLTQAPSPFTPARGEATVLDVAGFISRSTSRGQGVAYELEVEQVVSRPGGPVLRTLTTRAALPQMTGGSSPFTGSSSWDGKANGQLLEGGSYVLTSTIRLLMTHRVAPTKVVDRLTVGSVVTLVAPGSNPSGDYLVDPALNSQQRSLLRTLELSSATPIFVQTWPRAGTVYRLDLEAASGAPSSASLATHALAFVTRNAALWKLNPAALAVYDTYPAGPCSAVTLQLERSGVPVFNATLTVVVTPDGIIRSVTGRMSGEPFAVQSGTLPAAAARDRLGTELKWDVPLPVPVPVIFDTFFAYDGPHRAQEAWHFDEPNSPVGPHGLSTRWPTGLVVGSASRRVEVGSLPFGPELTAVRAFKCSFSDATRWSAEVVLDPLTHTAGWMNLQHMSGVKVPGLSDIDRAYEFLSLKQVKRWWGSNAPREHLREPQVRQLEGRAREVTLREYQAGIPVDRAYVSVLIDARDRVVSALARFVEFPSLPPPGANAISLSTARAGAETHYAQMVCGTSAACRTAVAASLTPQSSPAELVLLSPAIFEGGTFGGSERLAFRFEFPQAVIYWDALLGSHLLSWSTVSAASFWHQVWAPEPAVTRQCSSDVNGRTCLVPSASAVEHYLEFSLNGEAVPNEPFTTIPLSDGGIHPDTLRVDGFVQAVDQWFDTNFQWKGPKGDAGVVSTTARDNNFADQQVYVDALADQDADQAFAGEIVVTVSGSTARIPTIRLGRDATAQDIYAHEFMHAPTRTLVGYADALEPGALDESLSDIAAIVSTPPPDGGWDLGLLTASAARKGRPFRNIHTPRLVQNAIQHVGEMSGCNTALDPDNCVHRWVGIPNRAAALIAEGLPDGGGPPGGPFGKLAMADFMLSPVLKPIGARPHASDRFMNQLFLAVVNCKYRASNPFLPALKGGRQLAAEDCDFIEDAYRAVGVEGVRAAVAPFAEGWKPELEEVSLHAGRHLLAGCTLREHVMTVIVRVPGQPVQLTSSSTSVPPLFIQWPNEPQNWQVSVQRSFRGADTDPTDRSFRYTVQAKWLRHAFSVSVDEQFDRPPGVTSDSACVNNSATFEEELWETSAHCHFASFLDGTRQAIPVTGFSRCTVTEILGVHHHKGEAESSIEAASPGKDHGSHQFNVTPGNAGGFRLDATLNVFHDGTDAICARVAWRVEHPLDTSDPAVSDPDFCVMDGTRLAPPRQ